MRVSSGAARFRVKVRAESLPRALQMVEGYKPGCGVEVSFLPSTRGVLCRVLHCGGRAGRTGEGGGVSSPVGVPGSPQQSVGQRNRHSFSQPESNPNTVCDGSAEHEYREHRR